MQTTNFTDFGYVEDDYETSADFCADLEKIDSLIKQAKTIANSRRFVRYTMATDDCMGTNAMQKHRALIEALNVSLTRLRQFEIEMEGADE